MKKFLFVLSLIAISYAGLIWSGWGERKSWNQKVTLEIETPNGVKSKSTVLTYTRSSFPTRINSTKTKWTGLYGEAPFIEIEPGKYAFTLTMYEMYAILHEYTFAYGLKENQTDDVIDRHINGSNHPEIKSFNTPIFFTFRDLNDPTSIYRISNRFLGEGIRLKSIKYQVTDEPRTRGEINKILPWLRNHRGQFVSGEPVKINKNPNLAGFNRSILSRHYSCSIDAFTINNLTYGLYESGINCGF